MRWVSMLVCGLLASQALQAEEAKPGEGKPSDDSLRQLIGLTQGSRIVDAYIAQIEGTVRQPLQAALAGQPLNDKQRKIAADLEHNILAAAREQINWSRVEPLMMAAYRDSFTQHELDGILAFYRSDAGKAFVTKMPLATQRTMENMQGLVKPLTPRIVQLEKDAANQLKAAADDAAPATTPTPAPAAKPDAKQP